MSILTRPRVSHDAINMLLVAFGYTLKPKHRRGGRRYGIRESSYPKGN